MYSHYLFINVSIYLTLYPPAISTPDHSHMKDSFVPGVLGFVWIVLFSCLASDSPSTHQHISQEEKLYITTSLPDSQTSSVGRDICLFCLLTELFINYFHLLDTYKLFFKLPT